MDKFMQKITYENNRDPVIPFLSLGNKTWVGISQPYVVDIPPICTKRFASSFLMRTATMWNLLPVDLFHKKYDSGLFKA